MQRVGLGGEHLMAQRGTLDFPSNISHIDWWDKTLPYFFSHHIDPPYGEGVPKLIYQYGTLPGYFKYVIQKQHDDKGYVEQRGILTDKYRIQQNQDVESTAGINQYVFIDSFIPVPFSIKNPISTSFYLRLRDFSQPLNPNTLVLKIQGVDVASSAVKTPITGGLVVTYDPPADFEYGERVNVEITITDTDSPSNTIKQVYYFDIVDDYRKPFITSISPAIGSTGNSAQPTIQFDVLDYGAGVDSSTIELFVEGLKKTPDSITAITNGYRVVYAPSSRLPYDTEISIAVTAYDLSEYRNYMFRSWVFYTMESTAPWYSTFAPGQCEVLVDPRMGVVLEVYGLDAGIDEDSIVLAVDGRERVIIKTPKIYRRS